jgi:transglutaminase-like putative cysteine protease
MVIAESVVEHQPLAAIPDRLGANAWQELDALMAEGDYWEMLLPSEFAQPTPALLELAVELDVRRRDDPLHLLHEISTRLSESFSYTPRSTRVDSPIDEALRTRAGVCQDFAHIMIALVRHVGIPCRYVSGYLHHGRDDRDRSTADASHAWVEAFLPELGWVGFDPTNALVARDRHIRTALGRDYADVPPTRGLFRGRTDSEMYVAVQVTASDAAPDLDRELPIPEDWSMLVEKAQAPPPPAEPLLAIQQSQQQQQ